MIAPMTLESLSILAQSLGFEFIARDDSTPIGIDYEAAQTQTQYALLRDEQVAFDGTTRECAAFLIGWRDLRSNALTAVNRLKLDERHPTLAILRDPALGNLINPTPIVRSPGPCPVGACGRVDQHIHLIDYDGACHCDQGGYCLGPPCPRYRAHPLTLPVIPNLAELNNEPDPHHISIYNVGGDVRIEVVAEMCEQGCDERVRYWNDESGGNAACGCTVEGAESCDRIMMRPVVRALLFVALAAVDAGTA